MTLEIGFSVIRISTVSGEEAEVLVSTDGSPNTKGSVGKDEETDDGVRGMVDEGDTEEGTAQCKHHAHMKERNKIENCPF